MQAQETEPDKALQDDPGCIQPDECIHLPLPAPAISHGPARHCQLADCRGLIGGTVEVAIDVFPEVAPGETMKIGICASHLRMVQAGEVTGFEWTPNYRPDVLAKLTQ